MDVQRITVVDLKYVPETRCYEADFWLHLTDRDGGDPTNTYLCGRAERRLEEGPEDLAQRLLQDVRRQMGWMPEFRLGLRELRFPSEI